MEAARGNASASGNGDATVGAATKTGAAAAAAGLVREGIAAAVVTSSMMALLVGDGVQHRPGSRFWRAAAARSRMAVPWVSARSLEGMGFVGKAVPLMVAEGRAKRGVMVRVDPLSMSVGSGCREKKIRGDRSASGKRRLKPRGFDF